MKRCINHLFALVLCCGLASTALADGVRGGGSEPLKAWLEVMRKVLVDTLKHIKGNPNRDEVLKHSCRAQRILSARELATCIDFIKFVADEVIRENEAETRPVFVLVDHHEDDGYFDGEDGDGPTAKAAKTGPLWSDKIELNYPRIRERTYRDLFEMLVHEMGHKVRYVNNQLIGDADPVLDEDEHPTFAHGADLLDAVGTALYFYSLTPEYHIFDRAIRSRTSLSDWFLCEIRMNGNLVAEFRTNQSRYVPPPPVAESEYETGIEYNKVPGLPLKPFLGSLYPVPLFLRLHIHNYGACDAPGLSTTIFTVSEESAMGGYQSIGHEFPRNIICDGEGGAEPEPIRISYAGIAIECVYDGLHRL